ncbi:hypothetical protein ACOZ38_07955 [Sphaerisporangium viridialbum]|uniref:hypothetical protein n=1 Tax=Sphaerisporangium viridialbum TaxID=46189 RepID=UPI003C762AE9
MCSPGIVYGPQKRLAVHLRLTHELAHLDHDVIVWGPSSVGLDPMQRPDIDRQLREAAAATGSDLLVNVDARGPSGQINVRLGDWVPLMSSAIVIAAILGLAIRRVGRRLAHWGRRETRADSDRGRS